MENNNRINYLDYAKALAIFCVISIHVGFYQINKIVLFAMPLFFICTGYSYTLGKRTLKETIILRFKTIMLPFLGFMLVYTALEVLRAYLFNYGNYKIAFPSFANTIYGSGIIPFNGKLFEYLKGIMAYKAQPVNGVDVILPGNCHLWFLPATFIGYVAFALIMKISRNRLWIKIICIIFLLFIASLEVVFPLVCQLPFAIGRGAIGATFMLVGYELKESKFFENKSKILHLIVCIICALVYFLALHFGSDGSAMVRSYYGPYGLLSVLLTFVGGVGGAVLLLQVCRLIEKLPFTKIKKLLSFAGKNVMTLYALHMIVKFLLDAFYICVLNPEKKNLLDEYKMALLPQNSLLFMILEVIIIVVVCLLVAKLKNYLKTRARKK